MTGPILAVSLTTSLGPNLNSMKKITTILITLWYAQASCGAEPELESVLGRYFSNVTASPGRITATLDPSRTRIHYYKDSDRVRFLEKGEIISLTPGFAEVSFVERHSWIYIQKIGSGNVYEVTSAVDFRSFGKELEEKKYTLLFSQTELVFREGSPSVDKAVGTITANKKHDSSLKSFQSRSGGIKESQSEVLSGNPSMLVREQEFPRHWSIIAVLIAAGGLLWWLLRRRS